MLLNEGASVAICGRDPQTTARAVLELREETGGKVVGKAADVSNDTQVQELFRFVDSEYGGLDVLVNNAGVGEFGPVSELTLEQWRRTVDTNLSGAFYCSREALPRLETKGGGFIVNISSLAGKHAFAGGAAYNASKFGLMGFSEAMMQDARTSGVRVSTVLPGSVATGFGTGDSVSDWKIWPEDIAEVVKTILSMPERTLVSSVEVRPTFPPNRSKRKG
jgi:NAD(P)-dependent dehydrogenase (short-subunit alcohol dehydrogenase family)